MRPRPREGYSLARRPGGRPRTVDPDEKILQDAVQAGLAIQGWKTPEELLFIARHARVARFILDVGAWRGQTTKVMSMAGRAQIVSVDHLQSSYTGETSRNEVLTRESQTTIVAHWLRNLEAEFREGRVHGCFDDGDGARMMVQKFAGGPLFDFAWLDGDHGEAEVRRDIEVYLPLMRPGAVFAGHDYSSDFPDVVRVVNEVCPGFSRGPGTSWFVKV